jgi:hypothetical protein
MVMREFSIVWKLNFCIRARSIDQKQEYVGKITVSRAKLDKCR